MTILNRAFQAPPPRSIQSSPGSFLAAPPRHSNFADEIAQNVGDALGKVFTRPGPSPENQAAAALDNQKVADQARQNAAVDDSANAQAGAAHFYDVIGQPRDLGSMSEEVLPKLTSGGVDPNKITRTLQNLVATYGRQGDPGYDDAAQRYGVVEHGPLSKDSAYSTPRQNEIRQNDADVQAADRVAQEEGATKRTKDTIAGTAANNAATISAENAREDKRLGAQADKDKLDRESRERESARDPKVLGDLVDQALGATPAGKAPTDTDTAIDPMLRANVLARASELVTGGATRENAVVQALKEKGKIVPPEHNFFSKNKPATFTPIADAAAAQTAKPPAAAGAAPTVRQYDPKTGTIH